MFSVIAIIASVCLYGVSNTRKLSVIASILVSLYGCHQRPESKGSAPAVSVQPAAGYMGSDGCRSCHPMAYETWSASYHRTMTQLPSPQTVLGTFNVTLEREEGRWQLSESNGRYLATYRGKNGVTQHGEVKLLTGSHHLQNYWVAHEKGWLVQLPWVWWIKARRWIPVEVSFLRPPPKGVEPPTIWNDECVFCHTTQGYRGAGRAAESTMSGATELGIACEACHGQAQSHASRYRLPWNRYLGWLNRPRAHIEAPAAPVDRSNAICGQCHGLFAHLQSRERDINGDPYRVGAPDTDQRVFLRLKPSVLRGQLPVLGRRIETAGHHGVAKLGARDVRIVGLAPDGIYLAGEDWLTGRRILSIESSDIEGRLRSFTGGAFLAVTEWSGDAWRHALSAIGYGDVAFKAYDWNAFWDDGTMRTAGRALNGMVDSECASKGGLTCSTCHQMHGQESDDQLKAGFRGNLACAGCHPEHSENPSAHSHHRAGSAGNECQNCHMPHTTYGLLGATRAHRIDNPRPAFMESKGRPNACNLCHMDRSVGWAQSWVDQWYPAADKSEQQKSTLTHNTSDGVPAGLQWLLAGDPAQRAISTWHLQWAPTRTTSHTDRWIDQLIPILTADPYAAVRGIFEQVLWQTRPTVNYDFTERSTMPLIFDDPVFEQLLKKRSRRDVTIAE
ncbi:MAG: cytochrome c3 family protein [Bradymonadia bacterium]